MSVAHRSAGRHTRQGDPSWRCSIRSRVLDSRLIWTMRRAATIRSRFQWLHVGPLSVRQEKQRERSRTDAKYGW